jgi:hypothetical protein
MRKPGSACCVSGATSSGFGIALAVIGTLGAVSMATVFISAFTAVLIGVFSVAAAQTIVVALILRRTRGVVTWPMRPPQLAAGRRPAVSAAARPAIPARRPLPSKRRRRPTCGPERLPDRVTAPWCRGLLLGRSLRAGRRTCPAARCPGRP